MDETSVVVDATPDEVWALVSDITRMGEWSPECTGGAWRGGATGPTVGARFVGFNRRGRVRWRTHCRVTESVPGVAFAFSVLESAMTWGFRIEPVEGGTRLTEWRERTGALAVPAKLFAATGLLGRDRETMMVDGMERTLERMKATLERSAV
ncbi:SRPBCC family protein [Pseudonocardia yuanmonensis]|uniref:SRPBCC family protein n=1 Tax=Pseudonocardia yuanmonensis TaxID=1095914 RepID=A0ABP8XPW8_9PSEU